VGKTAALLNWQPDALMCTAPNSAMNALLPVTNRD
jgi:hypothetical protein